MSRGQSRDGVCVRRCYGQSCDGGALFVVRDAVHDPEYIDAPSAAEAKAEAVRRWQRRDEERARTAAERARRKNEGVEEWRELAAVLWRAVLKEAG